MSSQGYSVSIPIIIFRYFSVVTLICPIGVLAIFWKMGKDNEIPFFDILTTLAKESPSSLLYMLVFLLISLASWNIRLHITEFKIYYSVLGIPILWSIKREDISIASLIRNMPPLYLH